MQMIRQDHDGVDDEWVGDKFITKCLAQYVNVINQQAT